MANYCSRSQGLPAAGSARCALRSFVHSDAVAELAAADWRRRQGPVDNAAPRASVERCRGRHRRRRRGLVEIADGRRRRLRSRLEALEARRGGAAGSRYGFAAESASLISNRRSSGTRISADRLLPLHVAAAGDHVEPELVPLAFRRL